MKILLASSSSGSRGGGELYLVYLGRALAQRGHEVTLWASTHSGMDELTNTFSSFGEVIRSRYENTYDLRARSLSAYANVWTALRIAREWRKSGMDLVHINKQNLEDGLELLHAARSSRVPSLCTIHLTQTAKFLQAKHYQMRDWIARRALRKYPGLLVTVLENRRKDLLSFLDATPKVRLIPNGVPMLDLSRRESLRSSQRAELHLEPGQILFLEVGRLVPQKRPMLFLEKAQEILQTFPQARFLWVGDGTLAAEWDDEVARRNLGQVVRRLPWQMDVRPYLFAADVFLHVADFEGLPLAILEAMSAELPCAITPNLLEDMPFFNATNSLVMETAEQWRGTVDAPATLRKLGRAARKLAEAEFSFQQMAEQYETLYQVTARREA